MTAYLVRRVLVGILSIFFISVVSFIIIQMPPGDAVDAYTNYRENVQTGGLVVLDEEKAFLRKYWGLDRPLPAQYGTWMYRMLRGDFGFSFQHNQPVRKLMGERMLLTLAVAGGAVVFTWMLAVPIGIYSAVRQYSAGDHLFTLFGFLGLAVPNFLLALVFMYIAIIWLDQSVGGLFSPDYLSASWSLGRVWDMLKHLWIPAIVLGTAGTAGLIRIMRANLLDELRKPYVVTARAKGLSERATILKYPVRVALNPLVSGVAFLIPDLFSGAIIVSIVLSLPTLGPLLLGALRNQDMFLSGTIVLFIGALTVLGMLISDLLLVIIDPRIRLTRSGDR